MAKVRRRKGISSGEGRKTWIADYRDQHGKRHQIAFPRKKDAEHYLAQTVVDVRAGIHTADSASITIAEAAGLWLDHCKDEGLERSTTQQRSQHIRLHINPFIGRVKLSQLSAPMVNQFITRLRDNGRSVAMRRKVLTNLKTLISHAQDNGLVAQNAARGVKIKRNEREKSAAMDEGVAMPTKDELRAMLNEVSDRWRPLIVTAIFTGMRASELRGLPWDHVDLDEGIARVRQRADAWGTIGAPKSKAGVRDIPLAPMVVSTLREWKLACPNGELNLVFPNGKGNVEHHSNIWKRGFKPLQITCGMAVDTGKTDRKGKPILKAKYGLHALRHAAVSLFIEQGWTPKRVQTVIGHASIQMTYDLYGKLFKDGDDDRRAMEQVQARLLG